MRQQTVKKADGDTPVKELRAFVTECLNAVDPAKANRGDLYVLHAPTTSFNGALLRDL